MPLILSKIGRKTPHPMTLNLKSRLLNYTNGKAAVKTNAGMQ